MHILEIFISKKGVGKKNNFISKGQRVNMWYGRSLGCGCVKANSGQVSVSDRPLKTNKTNKKKGRKRTEKKKIIIKERKDPSVKDKESAFLRFPHAYA